MRESNTATTNSNTSTAARIGWALLILATLYVCYFSHLSDIGFVGPDEPRYAWIARDMAESGDWVTPRLYGQPWFEKPILYYWSAALFFKLSGTQQIPSASAQSPNSTQSQNATTNRQPQNVPAPRFSAETAARLPSAIYALLATLAMAWLALRLYSAETARWLLLLLPTTVGMIGFSHAAATDMPFSATLTIAMVFAAILLRLVPSVDHAVGAGLAPPADASQTLADRATNPATPRAVSFTSFTSSTSFTSLLFGFFLGLAVLAKGPAALILSGGAVFFWALLTKRWRDAFRLFHPVAIASFCLTALPWYILCARRNPDFFRVFIIEHNFKRYLTPEFQHIQPFWYYVPVVLLAFFPWTILFFCAAIFGLRDNILKKKLVSQATLYLLCWSAFCILFFSTSHSKLPGYILPALPAIGLLLSHFCLSLALDHRRAIGATSLAFAAVTLVAWALLTRTHIQAIRDFETLKPAFLAALGLSFVTNSFLGWAFLGKDHPQPRNLRMTLSSLPVVVILIFAGQPLAAAMNPNSSKSVAEQIQFRAIPLEKLFVLGSPNRGWRYGLDFYLHREIMDWDRNSNAEAYLISGGMRCNHWQNAALSCTEILLGPDARGWWILHVTPKPSTSSTSP